jgi:hypothetical protein
MEYQTRPRGSPEAKDCSATAAVLLDRMAATRLAIAPAGRAEFVGRFIVGDYKPAFREEGMSSTPAGADI